VIRRKRMLWTEITDDELLPLRHLDMDIREKREAKRAELGFFTRNKVKISVKKKEEEAAALSESVRIPLVFNLYFPAGTRGEKWP